MLRAAGVAVAAVLLVIGMSAVPVSVALLLSRSVVACTWCVVVCGGVWWWEERRSRLLNQPGKGVKRKELERWEDGERAVLGLVTYDCDDQGRRRDTKIEKHKRVKIGAEGVWDEVMYGKQIEKARIEHTEVGMEEVIFGTREEHSGIPNQFAHVAGVQEQTSENGKKDRTKGQVQNNDG